MLLWTDWKYKDKDSAKTQIKAEANQAKKQRAKEGETRAKVAVDGPEIQRQRQCKLQRHK